MPSISAHPSVLIQHKTEPDLFIHWDNEKKDYIKYSKKKGACIFTEDVALRMIDVIGKKDWQTVPFVYNLTKRSFLAPKEFLEASHYENH